VLLQRFISALGLFSMIGLAWLMSDHKRRVNFRVVAGGLLLQFIFALLVLRTGPGQALFAFLGQGFETLLSYVDVGMFAMAIMLAAKARGLDTCAQGAWNSYWTVTRRVLNVPEDRYVIFGISLGYADEAHPVNALVAEREPVEAFATFHGL